MVASPDAPTLASRLQAAQRRFSAQPSAPNGVSWHRFEAAREEHRRLLELIEVYLGVVEVLRAMPDQRSLASLIEQKADEALHELGC